MAAGVFEELAVRKGLVAKNIILSKDGLINDSKIHTCLAGLERSLTHQIVQIDQR